MSWRPFDVHLPLEEAYLRHAGFAVELRDPVTLERVTEGVTVTAVGLAGVPIVNFSGLFVWLQQPMDKFRQLDIVPGKQPFEPMEIPEADVARPLHTVVLKPSGDYPFTGGVTAIRAALYEQKVPAGTAPAPVRGATIRFAWLNEDMVTWQAIEETAATDAYGDFAAILRLARGDVPALDAQGRMSIRVFAKRGGGEKYYPVQLAPGRVTDAVYAWNEMV